VRVTRPPQLCRSWPPAPASRCHRFTQPAHGNLHSPSSLSCPRSCRQWRLGEVGRRPRADYGMGMAAGEFLSGWIFARALDRAAGGVLGPPGERAAAECFAIAADVAARNALERRDGVAHEAAMVHLTAVFEELFAGRPIIDLVDLGANQSTRLLVDVLREAVALQFAMLDDLTTPDGESQAAALGIDTAEVAHDLHVALIVAMRARPELHPLRADLFLEISTTQLFRVLENQVELQRLLADVRLGVVEVEQVLGENLRHFAPASALHASHLVEGETARQALKVPRRPLPDGFEAGRDEEKPLLRLLLDEPDSNSPGPSVIGLTTGLVGAGGFGKTTLAEWILDQPEVRQRFERILWIDVGVEPQLETVVSDAYLDLTGHRPIATDLGQLTTLFTAAVGAQRLLIVVDDVWSPDALDPFVNTAWSAVTIITTRQRDVLPDQAVRVEVDEISEGVAERIARRDLGLDRHGVAPLLERAQGWPLLLRLLNRAVHDEIEAGVQPGEAVLRIVEQYDQLGPASFDRSNERDRRRAVSASVGIGISQLARLTLPAVGDLGAAYRILGVFPPDTRIPLEVIQQLWSGAVGRRVLPGAVRRVCRILANRGLVQRYPPHAEWIELHDEIREHLRRAFADEVTNAHRLLLNTVRPRQGWGALPDESPYWWRHLAWHLLESGHSEEFSATVTDPAYLLGKVCCGGPLELEADLRRAAPTAAVQALERVLRQDGFCLFGFEEPGQAAPSFAARLSGEPELENVRTGVEQQATRPWLRPVEVPPDLPHPALNRTLTGYNEEVLSVTWSPDGVRLATGGADGTVRVWDGNDLAADPVVLTGHTGAVAVAWSPDGARLATLDTDGTVRIWDGYDLVDPVVLTDRTGPLRSVAVAWSKGDRLATAGGGGTVWVWDGNDLAADPVVLRTGGIRDVGSVAWSPDGARLATAGNSRVRVWNGSDLAADPVDLDGDLVESVAWSPDGAQLAAGGVDGVLVWAGRVEDADLVVISGDAGPVRSVAWSPCGARLATGGWDGTVRLSDSNSGADPIVLTGHTGPVGSVAWSPNGVRLATGGVDGTVRVWSGSESVAEPARIAGRTGVLAVAWSPDGAWLATGETDGRVRVWRGNDLAAARSELTGHTSSVRTVAWSPDGARLATADDVTMRVWDGSHLFADPVVLTGYTGAVRSAAWSSDGARLATAHTTPRVWDANHLDADPIVLTGHTGAVAVAWSPERDLLAVGNADGRVRVWDANHLDADPIVLTGHTGPVAVAWSPEGPRLATGGAEGTVRVWDGNDLAADPVALNGHTGPVAVAWSPDGARLATGGADGTVRVWFPAERYEETRIAGPSPLTCIAWHPYVGRIAVGAWAGWWVLELNE
jgi:WD40 repeat protein